MNRITQSQCHIHTFDPSKPPSEMTAKRHFFTPHKWGIAATNSIGKNDRKAQATGGPPEFKTLRTIMTQLNHTVIDVLKIDVEGAEKEAIPNIVHELQTKMVVKYVHQMAIEFHSVPLMKEGIELLESVGFGIVYARREDRCKECTEVTMVQL